MCNFLRLNNPLTRYLRLGDYLLILMSIIGIVWLFNTLWSNEQAAKLQIRQGETIIGTYGLNQTLEIEVKGPIGTNTISISNGRARFSKSPCHNQYCIHQGWLNRAGQAAICLPNQISLELIGGTKPYDSLTY